jgi:hypothetical protein
MFVKACGVPSLALGLLLCCPLLARAEGPLAFHLTFDPKVTAGPFNGRVYVFLSAKDVKQLPAGPNWFHPEPFFAVDVKGWKPGQSLVLDRGALGCPSALSEIKRGTYTVYAVMDLDRGTRSFSTAEGNGHSLPLRQELDSRTTGPVRLVLDQVYR